MGKAPDSTNAPVPLVDLEAQFRRLRPRIEAQIREVLCSGRFILGPQVKELETALANYCGVRHAIAVANGTDALKIALMAEGIGPGDAVFVPAFTFVATAEVVASIGASVVFVDIDEESFNIDPDDLLRRVRDVKREGRLRPRAVIPVDLFGLPADYRHIEALAQRHGLFVLADAAQSLGGSRAGRQVGSLAPVTATSFYPSKPLGCYGDGGCILTDNDRRAAAMRSIHRHGFAEDGSEALYVGVNSRLDTLQAAILLAKFEAFADELKRRDRIAESYSARLGEHVIVPSIPPGYTSAWAVYSIRVAQRDRVRQALAQDAVATGVYYETPLHLHRAYAAYGDGPGSLPVCERISREVLALPMHPDLDQATIERVCNAVMSALSGVSD